MSSLFKALQQPVDIYYLHVLDSCRINNHTNLLFLYLKLQLVTIRCSFALIYTQFGVLRQGFFMIGPPVANQCATPGGFESAFNFS